MMKTYEGILSRALMQQFPSGTAAATFGDWVANHVGLEQVLALAGFLAPEFVEVRGYLLWDRHLGLDMDKLEEVRTSFGDDPGTIERYYNTINLAEFFLGAADQAVHHEALVEEFGRVLQHFWSVALRARFPRRVYRVEIVHDLYDEEGACLTFWQDRT